MYRLQNMGKSAAAAEMLASLPRGAHVGAQTISNASRAMEQLLFRLGGLETIGRVLDSFFARPAVRVLMSEHVQSRTSSQDQSTVEECIETAKSFFTNVMAARGRRSDVDMNASGQRRRRSCP